jgi:hypothetical protein
VPRSPAIRNLATTEDCFFLCTFEPTLHNA